MRNFYIEQSSNRYTVNGEVTDWVTVPFNDANYGANYCGDIVCARTWLFVRDSVNAWYAEQVAAGKTEGADRGRSGEVRRLGPLRLRRRRQLRRARRLHRPLPVGARGRGRGDRRRRTGHRRDLEPPLVRLPQQHRRPPARPSTSSAASRSATPTSGSATTRSSRRTAASASSPTSSATTSACPTCTTRRATPAAPRTRPGSGRCTRPAPTAAPAGPPMASAPSRSR